MIFMGRRDKKIEPRPEHRWDHVKFATFDDKSAWTLLAYYYLWFMFIVSVVVYIFDTFTAINMLAFDRFFEEFTDTELRLIRRDVAKYIIVACIIVGFLNLFYEYVRAWKIIKSRVVADCYLDNLAVRAESLRRGAEGWKRFLVFAALTKSKQGVEYVALFAHFNLQTWFRVLVCYVPRQVVNFLVLYAYLSRDLRRAGPQNGIISTLAVIFMAIGRHIRADGIIVSFSLIGMVFTIIVTAFSFLYLLIAFFLYVGFLWHWIPHADGGLRGYCERKVNQRLTVIMTVKVNMAHGKEDSARLEAQRRAAIKILELEARLPTRPETPTLASEKFGGVTVIATPVDSGHNSRPLLYPVVPTGSWEPGKAVGNNTTLHIAAPPTSYHSLSHSPYSSLSSKPQLGSMSTQISSPFKSGSPGSSGDGRPRLLVPHVVQDVSRSSMLVNVGMNESRPPLPNHAFTNVSMVRSIDSVATVGSTGTILLSPQGQIQLTQQQQQQQLSEQRQIKRQQTQPLHQRQRSLREHPFPLVPSRKLSDPDVLPLQPTQSAYQAFRPLQQS